MPRSQPALFSRDCWVDCRRPVNISYFRLKDHETFQLNHAIFVTPQKHSGGWNFFQFIFHFFSCTLEIFNYSNSPSQFPPHQPNIDFDVISSNAMKQERFLIFKYPRALWTGWLPSYIHYGSRWMIHQSSFERASRLLSMRQFNDCVKVSHEPGALQPSQFSFPLHYDTGKSFKWNFWRLCKLLFRL